MIPLHLLFKIYVGSHLQMQFSDPPSTIHSYLICIPHYSLIVTHYLNEQNIFLCNNYFNSLHWIKISKMHFLTRPSIDSHAITTIKKFLLRRSRLTTSKLGRIGYSRWRVTITIFLFTFCCVISNSNNLHIWLVCSKLSPHFFSFWTKFFFLSFIQTFFSSSECARVCVRIIVSSEKTSKQGNHHGL